MKILTIANEKGGVGKTTISTQFAFYSALKFGLRVAFLDFDQQGNASSCLKIKGYCQESEIKAADILLEAKTPDSYTSPFVLFGADDRLSLLEQQGSAAHGVFADNLIKALKVMDSHFDLAIIDTNPNPDIRSNLGLIVCTHLVSPIQLTKEPIDGISRLFERIQSIAQLNPNLPDGFIGMLPNAVEAGHFQMQNAKELMSAFGHMLIKEQFSSIVCDRSPNGQLVPVRDQDGNVQITEKTGYAGIKRHAGIAEAQAHGSPMWEESGCSDAWSEMKKAFFAIYEKLDIQRPQSASAEQISVLDECRRLYGSGSRRLVRQFWMSDSSKGLLGLSPDKINLLRELKQGSPLSVLEA